MQELGAQNGTEQGDGPIRRRGRHHNRHDGGGEHLRSPAGSAMVVVCFFTSADNGNARYATPGFDDVARLDHGSVWPTAYALVDRDEDIRQRAPT